MSRSFLLNQHLISALSHKIRTPLSVVQNDLVFLKTLLPESECDRALRRCAEVNEILREAAALFSEDAVLEKVELEKFVVEVLNKESSDYIASGNFFIECDYRKTSNAFEFIRSKLGDKLERGLFFEIEENTLTVFGNLNLPHGVKEYSSNSLLKFFNDCLNSDSLYPAYISTLFDLQNFETIINSEKQFLTLKVCIPLKDKK